MKRTKSGTRSSAAVPEGISQMSLKVLQAAAREALDHNYTPPRRYGTAFHISPPALDIRDLKPTVAESAAVSARDKVFDKLPQQYQERIMNVDLSDAYLAWQLANMNRSPGRIMWVKPGQASNVSLAAGGLYWLFIGKGAQVTIDQSAVDDALIINRLFVWQEEQSQLTYVGLRAAITFLNEKIEVHLAGPGAAIKATHLIYGNDREQTDLEVRVYHEAQRTRSSLATRAAAAGQSRTIYRGLIDVDQLALATEGYQSVRGLLLSRQAVIDALPELAIRTNNVRCSHGVTTTHLNDLSLFYLRSRGLSVEQAREQALRGFFHHQLEIPGAITRRLDDLLVH